MRTALGTSNTARPAAAAAAAPAANAKPPAAAAATPLGRGAKPAEAEEEDISPLSKFKDWRAVEALKSRPPASCPAPPRPHASAGAPAAERVQAGEAHVAADVAQLVSTILGLGSASSCGGGPAGSAGSLTLCLNTVADPSVLALATDATLAKLLNGLQPLLRWDAATRQWAPAPGIAAALAPLQASCQERLRRTSLPCDAGLAAVAARFFVRVIREAGGGAVADSLLAAAAAYAAGNASALSAEVLAALHVLLLEARHQPAAAIAHGNRVVERLLRLHTKAGLELGHFADVVEALAQLRCIDGLSAAPVVSLAADYARALDEAGRLEGPQLTQLARVMNSVAVVAATAKVQGATLLAAAAVWHLLVLRTEELVGQGPGGGQAVPATLLSQMWGISRLLMTVANASSPTQLPDRLGLVSHAAWLEQEQRLGCGLSRAQRAVLGALADLRVPASRIVVNRTVQDVATIDLAVRMATKGGATCQIAILIRDPLRQLLRGGGARPTPLGSEAARESILQAAGWRVVALDSQTCLQLPHPTLADELGALMMGDAARSSLRFAA